MSRFSFLCNTMESEGVKLLRVNVLCLLARYVRDLSGSNSIHGTARFIASFAPRNISRDCSKIIASALTSKYSAKLITLASDH